MMAEQIRKPKPQESKQSLEQLAEDDAAVAEAQAKPAADTSDLDDLLDEIDSVLEENAQEFVAGYIQKGGQ